MQSTRNLPLGSSTDSVLDNLSLLNWANLLEESGKLLGAQASCKLLYEDSSLITLILGKWWCTVSLVLATGAAASAAITIARSTVVSSTAIIAITTVSARPIISVLRSGAGAWTSASSVVVAIAAGVIIPVTTRSTSVSISASATAPTLDASVSASIIAGVSVYVVAGAPLSVVTIPASISRSVAVATLAALVPVAVIILGKRTAICFSRIRIGCGIQKSFDVES